MTEQAVRAGRRRGGGGAARRAERTAVRIETARYITRNIPDLDILHDEAISIIETNAETILEEIGVNFVENPRGTGPLAWTQARMSGVSASIFPRALRAN